MILKEIGMIAADTSRSRVYVQSLIRNNLIPQTIYILANKSNVTLPGQLKISDKVQSNCLEDLKDECWSESNNNLDQSIKTSLKNASIKFKELNTSNFHDEEVIKSIVGMTENVIIYSGYGGVIIRKSFFSLGKKFLHVHGGYLPKYKGSTTNYYSIISENMIGASALFLDENIDSGPVLHRKLFTVPRDLTKLDHVYDNSARAKVLIETLKNYLLNKEFRQIEIEHEEETFFIIHPILKHIAILSKSKYL